MTVVKAIEALKTAFSEAQVLVPGSQGYQEQNSSYLSALESEIEPACILQPRSREEVARFVQVIAPFVTQGVSFAIKGGGQQPTPGSANIKAGITLDLNLLKGIQLKEGVVEIAAGERWGDVYKTVQAQGLGVSGSRSDRGGIGGLCLMGGLSFFSTREGFICDNVVNYEVVLADGSIVNANDNENADLWVALRGGGNNLGIVTRFDLRTFEQGPFWGGSIYYFKDKLPSQIKALTEELHRPDASDETHLMVSLGYAAQFGQPVCMNQMYYTKEVERPAVLDVFTSVQPQIDSLNTMRMLTLCEAASEQASDSRAALRTSYMNITVKADSETLLRASQIYAAELEKFKHCEGLLCAITFQPYPVSLLKRSAASGGNSLGLSPGDGPLVSILLITYWASAVDDSTLLPVLEGTLEQIRELASVQGTLMPFVYMNYAWTHQDPVSSYGAEAIKGLLGVSKQYDRNGLFQKGVPGGWKIPSA